MKGDRVIIDGRLADARELMDDPETFMSSNYVYARIHAMDHKPLHPDLILELAAASVRELYDLPLPLDREKLNRSVAELLRANNYPPNGSNMLTLYIFPRGGASSYMLSVTSQMLYRGFTIWHTPQKAAIVQYEVPFPHHRTGVSLMTHNYAVEYAGREGADVPLTESFDGVITGVGEYPLFAVSRDRIVVSPMEDGTPDSLERRLCIEACRRAGYGVAEEPVKSVYLDMYDELFYFAPQGVYPIRSCAGNLYPDIVSRRVAATFRDDVS